MKHRRIARLISVLLAALMLASVCSVSAFAKTTKTYKTYVSFGDSVPAGVSLASYKKAHNSAAGKKDYFINVPGTYVDIVAKKVNAKKLYPYAIPGMRSEELRMLLCNDYNGDLHEATVTSSLNGYITPGGKYEGKQPVQDFQKLRKQYQKAVKQADLITLGIGFNDVWFSMLGAAMELQASGMVSEMPELTLFKEAEKLGDFGAALKKAEETLNTVIQLTPYLPVITEAGIAAKARYFVNYRAIVERIYALNPDVTIVSIGYFEALIPGKLEATNVIHLFGVAMQPSFEAMNAYTRIRPTLYGKYYFADMHGTETIYKADNKFDPHPTLKGHRYMAKQILKVLP